MLSPIFLTFSHQIPMSAPPKPLFVLFGFDGGATCCHVADDRLFVGSQSGTVGMYGVETKLLEETVYGKRKSWRDPKIERFRPQSKNNHNFSDFQFSWRDLNSRIKNR